VLELQDLVRGYAARRPDDAWVRGTGWYSGIFGAHNLDRQVLDAAVPDRPVFIYASDGHNAAVNTKGCAALSLDATTADPPNGQFVRDAAGVPTGLVYEDAVDWVRSRMPKRAEAEYAEGVRPSVDLFLYAKGVSVKRKPRSRAPWRTGGQLRGLRFSGS
jgi:predicted amidohydrolase YtcJ